MSDILTIEQAAEVVPLSTKSLYRVAKTDPASPFRKRAGRWMVVREELIERLARHMHPEAWPELYPGKDWRRDKARENAQAVLALLEGEDDE